MLFLSFVTDEIRLIEFHPVVLIENKIIQLYVFPQRKMHRSKFKPNKSSLALAPFPERTGTKKKTFRFHHILFAQNDKNFKWISRKFN